MWPGAAGGLVEDTHGEVRSYPGHGDPGACARPYLSAVPAGCARALASPAVKLRTVTSA